MQGNPAQPLDNRAGVESGAFLCSKRHNVGDEPIAVTN